MKFTKILTYAEKLSFSAICAVLFAVLSKTASPAARAADVRFFMHVPDMLRSLFVTAALVAVICALAECFADGKG